MQEYQQLNIVDLIESNPITKLSSNYNSKLLEKIQESFTGFEQQLFITSFYCYLNHNPLTDFLIDLDNVWKWLDFKQKVTAKTLLEKNFKIDIDYKKADYKFAKQSENIKGGQNKETFLMNIKTFKLFCIKAGTKKADEIHEYFVKLEEILHQVMEDENNELKLQLLQKDNLIKEQGEKLEESTKFIEETEKLKQIDNIPTIYIYNIDTTREKPELKIGITNNVLLRIKPYRQVCKHGRVELTLHIKNSNIRILESYIHDLLSFARVKDEVFQLDVEEAKALILNVVDITNIMSLSNSSERQLKLQKMHETENPNVKVSTCEIGTQTDFDENVIISTPLIFQDNELHKKFNEFIETSCIVRSDVEVPCNDIEGQFRLWNREKPKKEVSAAFKNYLDIRFKHARLKVQDKNQVVYGYIGIKLKDIEYKKNVVNSDAQTFLFELCKFSPSGKILYSTLNDEYKKWKQNVGKECSEHDLKDIKSYLKDSPHILKAVVWTDYGNGDGYYGISLKKDENKYKKTSSTGKAVKKIQVESNQLLGTWETIAKAAEAEKISATKMSLSIKKKIIFDQDYYYCV